MGIAPPTRTPTPSFDVTIRVIDVNEGSTFADDQASFEVPENSGSSFDIGTVEAMADPEGNPLTYSLAGDGNTFFTINTINNRGVLSSQGRTRLRAAGGRG